MTITKRISIIAMVLTMLFSFNTVSASAASPVSFVNSASKVYTVKTKNAPWYTFAGQKITVENTGTKSMTVIVYNSNGSVYKQVTCLKPGKETTFGLKANKTYKLALTPHYSVSGGISAYITSNKYVSSVK